MDVLESLIGTMLLVLAVGLAAAVSHVPDLRWYEAAYMYGICGAGVVAGAAGMRHGLGMGWPWFPTEGEGAIPDEKPVAPTTRPTVIYSNRCRS